MSGVELPRRHRGVVAEVLAEHRLQPGERLDRGVGPQVLVAGQAEVAGDQVVLEAAVVRGGQVAVARGGELVLRLAGDAPLVGGDGHVVAHRHPRARLAVARDLGHHLGGTDARQRLDPLLRGLGAAEREQGLAQVLVDGDRRVGRGVDAAGDRRVDLPEGDLVRGQHHGLEPGAARLLDVVGRRGRRQLRAEHRLAGEVEVAAVLEHRAGDDLADLLAGQPEPCDQAVEGGGEHVLVGRPRVRTAGAGERDPVAADHRGAAGGGGLGLTCHRCALLLRGLRGADLPRH